MGAGSATVRTAALQGVTARPVKVEVSSSGGIPGLDIVGMPDTAVLEARSRVRCALRSSNFELPRAHITINLAPGGMRKTGTAFDLPIAVAILIATGQLPPSVADDIGDNGTLQTQARGLQRSLFRNGAAFEILVFFEITCLGEGLGSVASGGQSDFDLAGIRQPIDGQLRFL